MSTRGRSLDTKPLAASSTQPTSPSNTQQPPPPQQQQQIPSDPLHIAAQAYPWLYMSSTLDACFANAEKTASKELDEYEKQLETEETQLHEENTRHEKQNLYEFLTELESDNFIKEAPVIMQSFITHGEQCTLIEREALELAMSTPSLESEEPLEAYNNMMDSLDELQEQATKLESSILRLTSAASTSSSHVPRHEESGLGPGLSNIPTSEDPTQTQSNKEDKDEEEGQETQDQTEDTINTNTKENETNSAKNQILGVFKACLPVIRARIANLSMAQQLIDSAQENFSLALRMENMGIE